MSFDIACVGDTCFRVGIFGFIWMFMLLAAIASIGAKS